ncbi:MAG: T9SS type A sorting domain-containing protein [Paludibacter sp.]|nr:T9SS type A sorting domain-containing protein [Paludibacter sp.]
MKKTLLIAVATLLVTAGTFAQKTWIVGNDPVNFPVSPGIGAGPDLSVYKDGLGIHTGSLTSATMGQVEAQTPKIFGEASYPNRFKFNGAGYTGAAIADVTPTVNMPTQRYLTISVSGNGTIKIQGVSGNSGETRRLFITNGTSLIGTMVYPGGSAISEETVTYTGPATTLYLFTNQAINLYRIEASSYTTASVDQILSNKGISFNGIEIKNTHNLSLEVYDVLGKRIASSNNNISVSSFDKGVYFVRAEGTKETLKFSK